MTSSPLLPQEKYLFAGTYTSGPSKGIYVYRFNTETGDASLLSTAFTTNPSYLAISGDKRLVFAVNENGPVNPGEVTAYACANGQLQMINKQPSGGTEPCYVAIDKTNKWAVVGNYSGGNLSVFRIRPDGGLSEAVQTIRHYGRSVDPERQTAPFVHAAVFTPNDEFVAVADLGLDKVFLYAFDASKEKPLSESPQTVDTHPGSGPRHIIFHASLPFAYAIEEMGGRVIGYNFKNGSLTPIETINSHPEGYSGDIGSAAIRISTNGRYLYASNRGDSDTIGIFSIDQSSGKLTPRAFPSSGGENPRDFLIDPTGNFLLAANEYTNNIAIFKVNTDTGLIENTGKSIPVPSPVCVLMS